MNTTYDSWKTTEPDFWTDYVWSREDREDYEAWLDHQAELQAEDQEK